MTVNRIPVSIASVAICGFFNGRGAAMAKAAARSKNARQVWLRIVQSSMHIETWVFNLRGYFHQGEESAAKC